jgi:hypothetical protein
MAQLPARIVSAQRLVVALGFMMATLPLMVSAQESPPTNTAAQVTEAVNVVIHKPGTGAERPARVNDQIKDDEVLRTGERSLAEVEFKDKTVTRLGSKSVFTFDGQPRKYKVSQGIALICVPKATGEEKGKKHGEISSSALTAAIEGTTVLVQEMELPPEKSGGEPRHASRMIFLEGNGTLSTPDGKKSRKVKAGQMMVRFEDDPELPAPLDIDLAALLQGSPLMLGFSHDLPSTGLISDVIQQQQADIATGALSPTGAGTEVTAQNPTYQNGTTSSAILASTANCEAIGNGFFLCYRPCPDCVVVEPLSGGGYVCRHN